MIKHVNDPKFRKYNSDEIMSESLKEYLYLNIHHHTTKSFHYSKSFITDIFIRCLKEKDFSDEFIKKAGKKEESKRVNESRKMRGMKKVTITDENGNKSRQWRKVEQYGFTGMTGMTLEQFNRDVMPIDKFKPFSEPHQYLHDDPPEPYHDDCDTYY